VVSGDQHHEQEIVSEGQKEKGGIQDAKDDKPETADV
jgi:hypothetical protein